MMSVLNKRIERLESLGTLILEEATELRKELGLVPVQAPRKGLSEKQKIDLKTGRLKTIKRRHLINNKN